MWLGKWYTVCSIYLPHLDAKKNDILSLLQQQPEPFLLLVDINARHHLQREEIDNRKGKIFEELVQKKTKLYLTIMNPDITTFKLIATQPQTSQRYLQTTVSTSNVKFCPVSMEATTTLFCYTKLLQEKQGSHQIFPTRLGMTLKNLVKPAIFLMQHSLPFQPQKLTLMIFKKL